MSDRTDNPRFIKDTFLFLVIVTLVAAAIIASYSIASILLLDNGEDTLKRSRIDNIKEEVIGTAVSYGDSSTSPVAVQTKSPGSSDADNTASSTPVPPTSGMRSEEIVAEPALMPTPDRKASGTAINTSHGSALDPSTVTAAPSELQEMSAQPALIADTASATAINTSHGSALDPSTVEAAPSELQEVSAQPASIADAASATAINTSHGSTQGPSTVETAPSELSAAQEMSAQPVSIADTATAAQHAAGVTTPTQAISYEERDQMFRDLKIQRNVHTNLDQDSAAESGFDATSSRGAPPLRHATSHRQDAAEAEHKITQKLNRLELSRLLKGSRASR